MKDIRVPLRLVSILSDGSFHSGEQLGETLGMSRAAINKHMQTIRDWGLDVLLSQVRATAYLLLSNYLMNKNIKLFTCGSRNSITRS